MIVVFLKRMYVWIWLGVFLGMLAAVLSGLSRIGDDTKVIPVQLPEREEPPRFERQPYVRPEIKPKLWYIDTPLRGGEKNG